MSNTTSIHIKLGRLDGFFLGIAFPIAEQIGWAPLRNAVRLSHRLAERIPATAFAWIARRSKPLE